MATPFMESSQCAIIQPRRLKDFLQDQNLPFPRSRRSTISVILHAAVSSVKSSSNLRRSISRRFSNKNRSTSRLPEPAMTRTTSVTVKDILRWKSFRDLVDPVPTVYSPRCTTTTTTTSGSKPRSSWCDSDFSVDESPACFSGFSGDMEVNGKKIFQINTADGERKTGDSNDRTVLVDEEEQQFSPLSVLDFTQDHEQTFSPFHQILADIESRNITLKQQIQTFENLIEVDEFNKNADLTDTESFRIEEQAIGLMDYVKTRSSTEEWDLSLECLLIDFFKDELITSKKVKNNYEIESRVLSAVKSWLNGKDDDGSFERTRQVCIQEMDKRWNWKVFEDDQKEIVMEMEKIMLNYLLDELSIDLVNF